MTFSAASKRFSRAGNSTPVLNHGSTRTNPHEWGWEHCPAVHCLAIRLDDHGVGFDLYQDFGSDQAAYLDHAGSGTDVGEELTVRFTHLLPVVDVGDIDAGA